VQRLEIFLKWCQQDGAHNERDQQSRYSLAEELTVAAPAQGEHTASTGNQEEQRYAPRVDQEQDSQDEVALIGVIDVPIYQRIEGSYDVIKEDPKEEYHPQPIQIIEAGRFLPGIIPKRICYFVFQQLFPSLF